MRANEQIKSPANAIIGISAGGVIVVAVKQLTKEDPDFITIALALVIAFWIHTGARDLLGRLKDEDAPNTERLRE